MVYLLLGKMLRLLWQIFDIIGLIFTVANVQILKNNITIWSHYESDALLVQIQKLSKLLIPTEYFCDMMTVCYDLTKFDKFGKV